MHIFYKTYQNLFNYRLHNYFNISHYLKKKNQFIGFKEIVDYLIMINENNWLIDYKKRNRASLSCVNKKY